jgi:glycosyltransferase involved in cell wall biosynthesis
LYAWGLTAVDRIFVQHRGQLSGLNDRLRPKTELLPAVVTLRDQIEPHVNRNGSVAWVAVLREPKRPDLLVEIARRNPDLRFVVCGGTSTHRTPQGYSEEMARRLSGLPNVDYRGHVDPSETLEVISNATVLLSTSDQEGFPNTFLEAWSAGTPVVTLRIDPDDIIKRRGLGFVSGTIDQAASDIRSLVASETTFDAVSSRARSYVREVHSDDAVSQVFDQAILGAR